MMTVDSATSNGPDEKSCLVKGEKKGWLSKRTKFTHRWKPTWFHLKDTQLVYAENEERPVKTISLLGAVMETAEDGTFGWTITPKDQRRCFYLRACTAAEQQSWMLAIVEAQLGSREHGTNACVVQ